MDFKKYNSDKTIKNSFFIELKNTFFNQENDEGNLKNTKYKGWFTIFILNEHAYDNTKGQVESIRVKNAVLFSNRHDFTFGHETLHGFGLGHTFR